MCDYLKTIKSQQHKEEDRQGSHIAEVTQKTYNNKGSKTLIVHYAIGFSLKYG